MPTYMLDSLAEVSLSVRPLSLALQIEGSTVGGRLEATDAGGPVEGMVRPRADLLIIPRVDGRIAIRVVPIGLERFPANTVANLSVTVSNPGSPDPERAVLVPVDLAGLDSRELLIIENVDGSLRARAPRKVAARVVLDPIADQARVLATEILGVQSVEDLVAVNVVIAVDSSASMTGYRRDGTLDTVIEILAGVSAVITGERSVGGAIVGTGVTRIPVTDLGSLAATVGAAVQAAVPSSGLRSGTPGLLGFAEGGNTVTYLITDSVPADIAAFEAADSVSGEARHLVVVGTKSAWQLQTPPSTPHTALFIESLSAADPGAQLTSDPAVFRSVIRSLLAGCFPPGTTAYERVNQ